MVVANPFDHKKSVHFGLERLVHLLELVQYMGWAEFDGIQFRIHSSGAYEDLVLFIFQNNINCFRIRLYVVNFGLEGTVHDAILKRFESVLLNSRIYIQDNVSVGVDLFD